MSNSGKSALVELQAENERLRAHIKVQRKDLQLLTCKILTCGVAAGHEDPTLSRRAKDYGGPWDSPQAKLVRELRANRDMLLELVRVKDDALVDLLDGVQPGELRDATGLSLDRCKEICKMTRYIGAV